VVINDMVVCSFFLLMTNCFVYCDVVDCIYWILDFWNFFVFAIGIFNRFESHRSWFMNYEWHKSAWAQDDHRYSPNIERINWLLNPKVKIGCL
jgi:hypothetical protein